MDREYLENYYHEEHDEYERLVLKKIREGKFFLEKDKYPPDERFVNLQKPAASATLPAAQDTNLWANIPFCGSLIFNLSPMPKFKFEEFFFAVSEIPKVIDFIKETGRLQVALNSSPLNYEGLDYLDPFFVELKPPLLFYTPLSIYGTKKEIKETAQTFLTLAKVGYIDLLRKISERTSSRNFKLILEDQIGSYTFLKLQAYHVIVEEIENLIIDDPDKALSLLSICHDFIVAPANDLRCDMTNFALKDVRGSRILPLVYQPQEIRFPCEIGKFLFKKLTYAPQGWRACNELIDEYDAYDLRKVAESLNDAIVANNPDIVNKSGEELSEILDNIWNDKAIPRRVKGLKIGLPLSMAAIGSVAAGPIGAAGGFLAGLGFNVAHKFIDVETTGLSEKLAKLRTKSYQANIYDFKKKYKAKSAHP